MRFFCLDGDSVNCERICFDEEFGGVKMLRPLLEFFVAQCEPYLKICQHGKKDSRGLSSDFGSMETLLPADICQSRIAGRNSSSACTVNSCFFVQ